MVADLELTIDFATKENLALRKARKDLRAIQRKITALHFQVATQIDVLKAAFPAEALPAFLAAECAVPSNLVSTYLGLDTAVGDHRQVLETRAVPVSVLADLVAARSDVRHSMLLRIASDAVVAAGDAPAVARNDVLQTISIEQREADRKARALRRLAGKHLAPSIRLFEKSVVDFTERLRAFQSSDGQMRRAAFGGFHRIDRNDPAYRRGHESLRMEAATIRGEFERLYGSAHVPKDRWEAAGRRHARAVNLSKGYHALIRFSEGRFAHAGGFTFLNTMQALRGFDMWEALQHLCQAKIALPSGAQWPRRQKEGLTAIELCAGVGGQALGLVSAGFELVESFEKSRNAVKSLGLNRPGWKVSQSDITIDPNRRFGAYAGLVDLVSGGLPCQPYSGRGNGLGQFDKRDLFPTAIEIVKAVRPKAFFFENVEGFVGFRHGSHRAGILQGFEDLGYTTRIETIEAADYGVPQDRERILVIGMLPRIAPLFHMPVPAGADRTTIGSSIGDLLFPHRTAPEHRDRIARSDEQGNYDAWSDEWLERYGGGRAATVTRFGSSDAYLSSWKTKGFDARKLTGSVPHPQDFKDPKHRPVPRLTIAIIKRLQGFPDNWELHGKESGQILQLANAFPPQASRAVGLALRRAISGENLDTEKLLSVTIGKVFDLRLNASYPRPPDP